jgi:hypothetical protein
MAQMRFGHCGRLDRLRFLMRLLGQGDFCMIECLRENYK